MKVLKLADNKFVLLFTDSEIIELERMSTDNKKPIQDFIVWLITVGIKIYRLTWL